MRTASLLACSLILSLASCRKPCPKVEAPRPVPIVSRTPSCNLPAIPRPVVWGGVPQYDANGKETGTTLLTQDGLGELGGYLLAVRQWMAAAASCMEASR
jgi:hypothetical protein